MENIKINPVAFGLALIAIGSSNASDLLKKTTITRLALDRLKDVKGSESTRVVDRGGKKAVAVQESRSLTKKVLYLNTLSKKETGTRFISGYINIDDDESVLVFADMFVNFVLNYTY